MSAVVKLSSKLPGDAEINGLDARATWMLDNPEEMLVCVVYIDTAKEITNFDDGTHVPVARVRRIEPLGVIGDVPQAVRDAMAAAEQERTGRTPIPFEMVTVGEERYSDPLDGDDD